MATDVATAIGGAAALASTASFLPQAIKVVRTRDTSGISTGMYVVTVLGFILWTTYGVLQAAWPLIASNGMCLVASAFILSMKLLPRSEKEKVARKVENAAGKSGGRSPEAIRSR